MTALRTLEADEQNLLETFLGPRVDSSIFLLNNSRRVGLVDRGERFEGTYWGAFEEGDALEEGALVGVATLYWNGNVVLQAPRQLEALLAAIQTAAVRPIRGLLGPADQVGRAKEVLGVTDSQIQLDEVEGLYRLDLAAMKVPSRLTEGSLRGRRIERPDLDLAVAWRVDYCLEALGAEDTPELRERCRDDLESSLELGHTWVLEDGGEAVASSSFNAALDEVVQVGGVWTPPELRGRGYGRAAVAASLLDVRAESVPAAVLFTGDDNQPAIRAYAALGFECIGDYRVALFSPA